MPAGRWGPSRPLSRSHCSWGTSSSSRVTVSASEMPHGLPWHGRSQGGLGFGRCSLGAGSQGFHGGSPELGGVGKRPGCGQQQLHREGAGVPQGFGGNRARPRHGGVWGCCGQSRAQRPVGLGPPPDTHVCTQAAPWLLGSAQNAPFQPPSPCGFPNPSTKSPPGRCQRLRAAHRAALLIPLS